MKTAVNIFTLYLLLVSLLPCSDGGEGIVVQINHWFGIEHDHSHESHSNGCEDDVCPPFCTCNCCSCPITFIEEEMLASVDYTPVPEGTPHFLEQFLSASFTHSIWQPPNLS